MKVPRPHPADCMDEKADGEDAERLAEDLEEAS